MIARPPEKAALLIEANCKLLVRAREIIQWFMEWNWKRFGEWWMRRLFLCLLLLAVGCRAQSPNGAELNRKIERQVRSTFGVPPYVDVTLGERTPSKEFAGYDHLIGEVLLRGTVADPGTDPEQGRQDAASRWSRWI